MDQTAPLPSLSETHAVDGLTLRAPAGLLRPWHLTAIANGAYEAPEIALAAALARPSQRVLEFGGGIGIVSRALARLTGPGTVLSVEANPAALAVAQDHLARDGLGVSHRWGMVVAEGAAPQSLEVDPESFLASRPLPRRADALSPPAHSLSALIADWNPQGLVVDIEGGERGLFPPTDLSEVAWLVVELHPAVIGAAGCLEVVQNLADQGLAADPRLVAGPVLGFTRTPTGPAPSPDLLTGLFSGLAADPPEPGALRLAAGALPQSPLLQLLALTHLPRTDPARRDGLAALLSDPMAARGARNTLVIDHLMAGAFAEVVALLREPATGHEQYQKARALLPLSRPAEALALARAAVAALPWFAQAHFLHARAALATADRQTARAAAARAHALDPATPGLAEFAVRLNKLG